MNKKLQTILIWFFAILFTAALAIYQRMSGPTYPIRGKVIINNEEIKYRLLRTSDDPGNQKLEIKVSDTSIRGTFKFRRFKSHDNWTIVPMQREGENLVAFVPHQPPAGKVMYYVSLNDKQLNPEPTILRYKGAVPIWVIIPHVVFIFLAMFFAVITLLMCIWPANCR